MAMTGCIVIVMMVILPASGKGDIFSIVKNAKLSASPIGSSVEESTTLCSLRCIAIYSCLAFNFNTTSGRCELLDKNTGILSSTDHIIGRIGEWRKNAISLLCFRQYFIDFL